jgi:hypothetical protein
VPPVDRDDDDRETTTPVARSPQPRLELVLFSAVRSATRRAGLVLAATAVLGGLATTASAAPAPADSNSPRGWFEQVSATATGINVKAWALDPNTTRPVNVWVSIDGQGRQVRANTARPDIARTFPTAGAAHGLATTIAAAPGKHEVCLTVRNLGPGRHTSLGCKTITTPGATTTAPVTTTATTSTTTGTAAPVVTRETTTTTTTASRTAARTAPLALHPFAATSPWNAPISAGTTFESRTGARTSSFMIAKPVINRGSWSIAVRQAKTTDPQVTLQAVRNGKTFQIRVPAAADATGGLDRHLTIIQPDGYTAYDMYKFERISPTQVRAAYVVVTDLRGTGTHGGTRAAATPAVAGLIRTHELNSGNIPHALAVAVPDEALKSGPVGIATRQDANAATAYSGNLPMGTRLAIPANVNIDTLNLSPEGRALAKALQTHGAYVVDRAEMTALYCELDCDPTKTQRMATDWRTLHTLMRATN